MKEIVDKINKSDLSYPLEERHMYHINCAEALLMAANEEYNLGLDDRFIKAVCPFGGGFQIESTCGALLGSLSAIGVMFTEDRPTENEKMRKMAKKYAEEFEKEFGALDCATIKQHHRSETEGCAPVKIRAAEVFERVMLTQE